MAYGYEGYPSEHNSPSKKGTCRKREGGQEDDAYQQASHEDETNEKGLRKGHRTGPPSETGYIRAK